MRYKARIKGLEIKASHSIGIDPMVYEALDLLYSNIPKNRTEEDIQRVEDWMNNSPEMAVCSPEYESLKKAYGMV
ncbi:MULTISPECIES: hypothetical protein [unclassified Oceanispirochaeta]|uniref:hypothetical protein n=1 Tax=unclassified Oceanispirochaeta TaxID=2635722 RepID=UPI000E09010C|nr:MULTISPECIES: hypothetical protein [unclassified Oceanispirochaeta]MBF9018954.1 hypothetical protein [Oceanispirochaeta sp. M2]NPD75454.1 hypothetical protein [Oceanispirochaeta sp. M1]RDG28703.1 hypothetical protein DV872_25500 [Oceanispirochaeta sp. M1]